MQRLTFGTPPLSSPSRPARSARFAGGLAVLSAITACSCAPANTDEPPSALLRPAAEWTIAAPPETPRPPFTFNADDDKLLDEVEKAAFWFLWRASDPDTGMVVDRTSVKFASIAGVGFQLAALPAGVERRWVTREAAQERAERILRALESNPENRKAGLFYHYLRGPDAAPVADNDVVSTIDSALLFAGVLVAGQYFGGESGAIADRLIDGADWSFFVLQKPRSNEPYLKGFVSLGWKPADVHKPTGEGSLLPFAWADAGDEQRLVSFLAAASPNPAHRVDPAVYYRLRRALGDYKSVPAHVWFPWTGALFKEFFAHCFLDYAHMGPDDPAAQHQERRPRVDWWENARRASLLHRTKCIENPKHFPGFGENAWGLSACDSATGYAVFGVFPRRIRTTDEVTNVDFAKFDVKDNLGDGTLAPYAAASTVMFDPAPALAALRYYRTLAGGGGEADGHPLVWRDPGEHGETGEYGFRDAYNQGTGWVAPDYVSIDQGPLVLAIENARTGLIWRTFHAHPVVRAAMDRLGLSVKDRDPVAGHP